MDDPWATQEFELESWIRNNDHLADINVWAAEGRQWTPRQLVAELRGRTRVGGQYLTERAKWRTLDDLFAIGGGDLGL